LPSLAVCVPRSPQAQDHIIKEDIFLSDSNSSYLLKRGFMLQIPTKALHTSPETWGEDSYTFNAARFLPSTGEGENSKKQQRSRRSYGRKL
jgi:hypothetical protein